MRGVSPAALAPYRLLARLGHGLPLGGTAGESLAARRDAAARWCAWAATRPPSRHLVLVHGASVGELLTAQPIVRRLRRAVPALQVAQTFTSPSAARWSGWSADRTDYLPLDEPAPVDTLLTALAPRLVVFARGDLWPELVTAAAARGIPIAVVGASVRPKSLRLAPPVRGFLARLHRAITWLGAASDRDAARWIRLGVSPPVIHVTGDPRHDEVIEHPPAPLPQGLVEWRGGACVLVAGSTEPRDEPMLLAAFRATHHRHPEARLVLVPHASGRAQAVAARARRAGIAAAVWEASDAGVRAASLPDVVIVESRGILADLYALGQLAYVGGGFDRGVHAVIEPAARGVPVIVGPRGSHSGDVARLVAAGAAVPLPQRRPGAVRRLAELWSSWLAHADTRRDAGLRARRTLEAGAAARSAEALLELI